MELAEARGKLVAIGGSEDKEKDCTILKEFVRLARGPNAKIVVMTVATDKVEETGKEYLNVFKGLGVDDVQIVDVSTREDAQSEAGLEAIKQATGIFFTGGDQLHITALLGGSSMHKTLFERYQKGVVIAGTSAGASMMGNSMILKGDPNVNPRVGGAEIGPAMDLIIVTIIDVHFSQRGRMGRLLTAVAHFPQDLGIGIDENTAIVITDHHFEVIGDGAVTVIDAGGITYTNMPDVEEDESLALHSVNVHILPSGCGYDLAKRAPIIACEPRANGDKARRPKKTGSRSKKR